VPGSGLHPDYHTDRDTWDRINYPKLTKIARRAAAISHARTGASKL
jgi:hypothetical protein